ncbi:c-type cytochrome [Paenochrobactrum sp. BZR 588]|uniref:c-type cytochrome n=1 Tax=Paenochrobactrum TaxID=999488 RepID=UPI0035BC4BA9
MRKFLMISTALALFSTIAQADVIEDRKAIMKDIGKSVGVMGAMMKGEVPFNNASAIEALKNIQLSADKFDPVALFPEGTDKGDTEAAPAIWQNMEDFTAHVNKFREDAAQSAAADPQDLDQLKPVFQQVAANCKACHELYRVKK